MSTLLVMMVLLASAVSTESSADSGSPLYICGQLRSPHCKCLHWWEGVLNKINCKHPETGFEIFLRFFREDRSVVLDCEGSLSSTYFNGSTDTQGLSMISELQIGVVNELTLYACPFIDSSLEDLLASIGVTDLKNLHINSYTFKDKLKKKHFQHLHHVKNMTLNSNGITSLPSDIFDDMRDLVYLQLQHNYLSHLPQAIFNSTIKLEEIDLKNNSLTRLDSDVFKHLHSLKKLHLSGNRLTNLSKAVFSDVQNLENLDLDAIRLETVEPDFFANLTKLKTLDFFTNPFFTFSKELLSKNTELEELNIYGNDEYITNHINKTSANLPSGFLADLFHLKVVRLCGLRMTSLPEDIFNGSSNIKEIHLTNNLLITLPENIFIGLKELEYLDLSQNKIANLPEDLFKANTKLKRLNMNHNILKKIPRNLLAPLKLEFLDLSYNEMWDISESFIRCPDLKVVNLSNNRLTSVIRPLPEHVGGRHSALMACSRLEEIHLAHNSLTEIYDDWRQFRHLHTLDLSFNSFQCVSINDLHFHGYVTIELSNNNISVVSLWDTNLPVELDPVNLDSSDGQDLLSSMTFVDARITRIKAFEVFLDNNPFKCDCHLQPFVHFLQTHLKSSISPMSGSFEPDIFTSILEAIYIPSRTLKCHEPKTLKNEKLTSVDQNLLICALNSSQPFDSVSYACPDNCSCHYRAVDRANVFNCSNTPLSLPLVNKANHSELILTRSQLTKFHLPEGYGYENLTRLDLSHNSLNEFTIAGISAIKELDLSYNHLTDLSNTTMEHLQFSPLSSLVLHANPWLCDCDNVPVLRFIQSRYYQLKSPFNVTCSINGVVVSMQDVTESELCINTDYFLLMVILCLGFLLLDTIVLTILCYLYPTHVRVLIYSNRYTRGLLFPEEYDDTKEYDAFISYSNDDVRFVTDELIPLLEEEMKLKLCLHYRNWIPGDTIPDQITRSVMSSRRTIVILSSNYLTSEWGIAEFKAAHGEFMKGTTRVIVILYDKLDPGQVLDEELKVYLKMNTYLEWGSKWAKKQLLYALPHPPKAGRGVSGVQYNHSGQVDIVDGHRNQRMGRTGVP